MRLIIILHRHISLAHLGVKFIRLLSKAHCLFQRADRLFVVAGLPICVGDVPICLGQIRVEVDRLFYIRESPRHICPCCSSRCRDYYVFWRRQVYCRALLYSATASSYMPRLRYTLPRFVWLSASDGLISTAASSDHVRRVDIVGVLIKIAEIIEQTAERLLLGQIFQINAVRLFAGDLEFFDIVRIGRRCAVAGRFDIEAGLCRYRSAQKNDPAQPRHTPADRAARQAKDTESKDSGNNPAAGQ